MPSGEMAQWRIHSGLCWAIAVADAATQAMVLDKAMEQLKAESKTELDGEQAFRLFDTYGFPLDLTELICRENGFTVNEQQFDVEMQKQKERARNAAAVENSDWTEIAAGEQQFVGLDRYRIPFAVADGRTWGRLRSGRSIR